MKSVACRALACLAVMVSVVAGPVATITAVAGVAETIAPPTDQASVDTNPFIPESVDIGDCISSLPRPGCGSEARTSGKTLAAFGLLMLGTAFIGWRVARGVRQRDKRSASSRS